MKRTISIIAVAVLVFAGRLFGDEPPVVLENDCVLLEMSPHNGTIGRILDKASGIDLSVAPALAENFRLILLLPEKKTATILGKDQKLSGVHRAADGLALTWDGPLKDTAGAEHKIAVRMDVKAVDNELQFGLHLDNGAACKVKEAWYPMIGGLTKFGPPGGPADGVLWVPISAPSTKRFTPWTKQIELPFGPPQIAVYPWGPDTAHLNTSSDVGCLNMSFTCVQSEAAGKTLYIASHDEILRHKAYQFEQRTEGPVEDVFASIRHFPFTPPGKAFDGSTVVLRVIDGDWHAAGKIYRTWYEKTFGVSKPSQCWIRRESFFLFIMCQLPEGTINLRFKDIPQLAKDAKDHGINTVQISGWNVGGHDNGYPNYTPNPRLGTWQELEDGIKACHKMGMKIYFFVNYQPAMLHSDWYKKELVKYREHGPDGKPTFCHGYGMGTVWARLGHPKMLTWISPAFPEYRKILVDQFVKLARIGADGIHVDKMVASAIDYNPDSPLSPDSAPWEGAAILTKEIMAACRKYNPNWAMSFECYGDMTLRFSGATWWVGNQLVTRRVFPENAEMLSITSAYDYLGVNNAVRSGHTVMLAPLNFCRSISWKPWEGLADYIKEVKRVQDSLLDTVYLGEVLGHEGVRMSGEPAAGVDYNVFRNLSTGKHVCILTNATMQPKKQVVEAFEANRSGESRIHTLFQEAKVVKLPAEIEIPAEQIIFVEEL